jgi:hypothetical protein
MPKKTTLTFKCWINKASRKPAIIAACMERGIVADFNKTPRFVLLEMWRATLAAGYTEYVDNLERIGRHDGA